MIAIPLNKKSSTIISELYGNAPYFAMLNIDNGDFTVKKNTACGNGLDTAEFIKSLGASSTIFYHMGEGLYNCLTKNGIKVISATKNHFTIDDIYRLLLNNKQIVLNKNNYKELLDSGTSSCTCNN